MRICLNLLAALAGGQLTRARAFVERFERYAPDSSLVVLKESSVLEEWAPRTQFDVLELSMGGLGRLRALKRSAWEHRHLQPLMRDTGADLFLTFSHYLPANFPSAIASVVGVANLQPFSPIACAVEKPLTRLKLALLRRSIISSTKRATSVIALSEACRKVLVSHGVDARKIAVIPNGLDSTWQSVDGGAEVLAANAIATPYLLYVSHFYRYKSHETLIRAYASLPATMRAQHQLVLVGWPFDRAYFDELVALCGELGVSKSVVFIEGESGERLRRLYRDAHLFVFPSLVENSPNSLLEAMAAGAPVMAVAVEPMPEFCGAAAAYFQPCDSVGLGAQIERLLADPARLETMRGLSRERAAGYSWDAFVSRVVDTCRETLRSHQLH